MKEKEAKVLDYKFRDFAHVIHDYAKPDYPVDLFVQEMFDNIVTDDYEEVVDKLESKTFGYYYTGRSINELCRSIGNNLDEDKFTDWLDYLELDDDHWNLLYKKLKDIGIKFDKKNKNKSIAKYFKNLIFDRSIIKTTDNITFKLNIADEYINKTIKQENMKLDSKIAPYYEYKRSNKGDKTNIYLQPKTEEIAKKVPIKVVGKFDVENATEDELYNLNHLNELGPLINYNNQPLVLPKIKESSKSINGVSISNESVEINEVGLNLILFPRSDLKKINVNFNIYNNKMNVNLKNIELTQIHLPTKTYFTNKNRCKDYPYDFEMVFNINDEKTEMTYGFNIGLRQDFVFDVRTILKFYKISRMLEDHNSIVKITTPELDKPLFYKENYGNKIYTDYDYKNMNRYIEEVEKIIFLEDAFDVRFKFDVDWLKNNTPAIDIAYASLKHDEVFVYVKTSWTLESDINSFNDLSVKSRIKFESELSTIELFNEVFDLPKIKLFINDGSVESITVDNDKKKLIVTAQSITASSMNKKE